VPVTLRATLSEVGTLEVAAVSDDGRESYRLELDMRSRGDDEAMAEYDDGLPLGLPDPDRVEQATEILASYFAQNAEPPRWKLVPRLESVLKVERSGWPLSTVRSFFEALRPDKAFYTGPPEIQATWYNITGYCLRPGFGFLGDEARMDLMLPVLRAGCNAWDPRARTEWWVMWRRVAGGLDRRSQEALLKDLLALTGLAKGRVDVPVQSQAELVQVWMLAASLERANVRAKADLGEVVLRSLEGDRQTPEPLWCLGRLGARVPVHGGLESVIPTDRAEDWVERLLKLPAPTRSDHYALALALLGRRTDDRSRDLDERLREQILERLVAVRANAHLRTIVEEVVADEPLDATVLGEGLPPGLRLLA
jgi:hypothetical protein